MIKSNDIFGISSILDALFLGENFCRIQSNLTTIGTTTDSARALGTPLAVKLQKYCLKLPGIAIATTS